MTPAPFVAILVLAGAALTTVVLCSLRLVASTGRSLRGDGPPRRAERGTRAVLSAHRKPLALLVTLSLSEGALGLAAPWPLKVVVDNAIGGASPPRFLAFLHGLGRPTTAVVAAGFGIVLVGALAVVGYAATLLSTAVGEVVGLQLRADLLRRLLQAPLGYLDSNHSGDFVSRLTTDVARVQDSVLARVEVLVPESLAVLGMTALMALLSPLLAVVVLAVVPALALVAGVRRRAVGAAQRASRAASAEVNAQASELVRNVRLVRSFGQQDRAAARLDRAGRDAAAAGLHATRVGARLSPAADVLLALDLAVVLVVGSAQVAGHRLSLGGLLVFLAYLSALQAPVRSLSRLASTLGKGAASAERIDEVTERAGPPATLARAPAGRTRRSEPVEVLVDGVSFAYPGGPSVLDGVSFSVDAGSTTVLFGPSGSGKSTLLNLVVRLHDADRGAVLLGGEDVRSLDLATLHGTVALVPQDAWLVAGTIAENVGFGAPDATEEEIRAAARLAHVEEFVDRLPLGWSTEVGEGGVRLSGGQRRRIALARALLACTPVLVLDEPTAGLDPASRAMVVGTIASLAATRTMLVATHDEQLATVADRVLVVEAGSVRPLADEAANKVGRPAGSLVRARGGS